MEIVEKSTLFTYRSRPPKHISYCTSRGITSNRAAVLGFNFEAISGIESQPHSRLSGPRITSLPALWSPKQPRNRRFATF